jgi:hypothetical protein
VIPVNSVVSSSSDVAIAATLVCSVLYFALVIHAAFEHGIQQQNSRITASDSKFLA